MNPASAPNGTVLTAPLGQQPAVQSAPPLPPQKPRRRVLTSLALQIFIFFGGWWSTAYYILNILVFVYKGVQLPYPKRNFGMEFTFSWLWVLIEAPRLFLASKGNKTERVVPLIFSIILGLPLIGLYLYFILGQTYVLKIDLLLNVISLVFVGIQYLFSILTMVRFIMAARFAA